ncbi:LOW QUALITY PROTEIN: phosphopantothenate-cysteine ligase /phosphopantothenoylcysteine decarboxylase [Marinifilum flexuosum]|uniref:Coenzyme A biosynthesis bifunctional protein CoaBC n=1 Tax=Marinifilum flexuosum TaxID=1117708 RepID=A0A419X8Y0_9BACT|nr:LOW QUALITY PROTEIN: phosphopantothenate-cysteine ligase /phosphopantothenoylcysteine decarboxylase [Marinifilum flexuosum]
MLKDKNIILGITASIAAYKAASLVRLLVKEGANVKVIMTPYAKEFISPVTMATLSKNTVLSDFFKHDDGSWNSHVDLGIWADVMIIAPTTANTMAKMAHGICDNLLLTTYLSAKCPVVHAPAMDLDMFKHPATLRNMDILRSYGDTFIEPSSGELASGLYGKGRMEEPEIIAQKLSQFFEDKKKLSDKKILITTGPTYEKIDPVRFIGNFSSGKMGFAIAEELAENGANVVLVSGPTALKTKHPNVNRIDVVTAEEMYQASIDNYPNCNGGIMTAAVADFTPLNPEDRKVKRGKENYSIELTPTKDIAASLGKIKAKNQFLVGFALETNDEEFNAKLKLEKKNLDFIVLNSLNDSGAGFQHDTNKISIIDNEGSAKKFELKPKTEVAKDIVEELIQFYEK